MWSRASENELKIEMRLSALPPFSAARSSVIIHFETHPLWNSTSIMQNVNLHFIRKPHSIRNKGEWKTKEAAKQKRVQKRVTMQSNTAQTTNAKPPGRSIVYWRRDRTVLNRSFGAPIASTHSDQPQTKLNNGDLNNHWVESHLVGLSATISKMSLTSSIYSVSTACSVERRCLDWLDSSPRVGCWLLRDSLWNLSLGLHPPSKQLQLHWICDFHHP